MKKKTEKCLNVFSLVYLVFVAAFMWLMNYINEGMNIDTVVYSSATITILAILLATIIIGKKIDEKFEEIRHNSQKSITPESK